MINQTSSLIFMQASNFLSSKHDIKFRPQIQNRTIYIYIYTPYVTDYNLSGYFDLLRKTTPSKRYKYPDNEETISEKKSEAGGGPPLPLN